MCPRSDSDTQAVWMSGHRKALYFWVLQRHSIHGEPELRKVAGYWKAPHMGMTVARRTQHIAVWFAFVAKHAL